MIEIVIFKNKKKDGQDSGVFKTIVELARMAFGQNSVFPCLPEEQVKIIMIRKKHYGNGRSEMRILIDRVNKTTLEEERNLRRFFEDSNKGANFPVQIDVVNQDYFMQF